MRSWNGLRRCLSQGSVLKNPLNRRRASHEKRYARINQKLARIPGVRDIAMTTNGSLSPVYAERLKEAGLKRVTVSLDSLEDERFKR